MFIICVIRLRPLVGTYEIRLFLLLMGCLSFKVIKINCYSVQRLKKETLINKTGEVISK